MPVIEDTITSLKTRRDEIETEIAPQLTELQQLTVAIRALERSDIAAQPRAARTEPRPHPRRDRQ